MASVAEHHERKPWSMARVIIASSAGTAFEWYDFFIFGSLAPVISKVFFAGLEPTPALIAALALFAAGFAFRPLGALIFGVVGDRLGRKGAFLVTVSLMGAATFLIGFLPTYAQSGSLGPTLLIFLRILLPYFGIGYSNSFMRFTYKMTEPVLRPLRKVFTFGMVDFSAWIALILVQFVARLIAGIVMG